MPQSRKPSRGASRRAICRIGIAVLVGAVAPVSVGIGPAHGNPFIEDCGTFPMHPTMTIANWNPGLSCSQAVGVMTEFFNSPGVKAGDKGATIGAFTCIIYGAAETESHGHVAECENPAGSIYLVAPNPRSPMD